MNQRSQQKVATEYDYKIQRRGACAGEGKRAHYTTYLEMISEKGLCEVVTMALQDGVTCRLDDIGTTGDFVMYDKRWIGHAKMSSTSVRVRIPGGLNDDSAPTGPIFAIDGSFRTGTSILQIMSGSRYFFLNIIDDCTTGVLLVNEKSQEELDKQQGKIICHFIYGTGAGPKVATEFVPIGSSLFSVLPRLSALFGVPITILGCRLVHLVEDGMIVTKYGADNDELKEFAAYLFEERSFN
ncbi:unnamed protein product [Bursaphelenchus xylophilus]|uniref:(pine wood nematode) hypothetical protein n=1 Tax=Bursaphelenchus xylophilus TaxID=6326 RepID=A0A811JXR5_BURXY|nr:unnamed protein product [Bursaphelenchus xylophilus]CAG9081019.1 unnamed protein product [Bursaphelenchus xylophilus]